MREAAESARRLLATGQDPGEAKKQAKQERIAALQNTFRNLVAEWYEHQRAGWTAVHAAKVWRSFEADILPALVHRQELKCTVREILLEHPPPLHAVLQKLIMQQI